MAIWAALIPLALSAAGAGASYAGQRKASKAQEQVLANYRSRNKQREAEANAVYQQSLNQSGRDTADAELEKGTQRRLATYEQLGQQLPTQPLPLDANKNKEVKTGGNVKNAGTAWSRLMRKADAKLGSYSDWNLQQGIKNTRTNQEIARITTDAKSDFNNVVPVEMIGAARKGDALQGWGALLSAAGTLTGMGAALSAPASAAGGSANFTFGAAPSATSPLGSYVPGMSQGGGMWSGIMSGLP